MSTAQLFIPDKINVADVKTRIGKVSIHKKKRQLEALETRLEKIVSPELRAEMELQAIKELLEEG